MYLLIYFRIKRAHQQSWAFKMYNKKTNNDFMFSARRNSQSSWNNWINNLKKTTKESFSFLTIEIARFINGVYLAIVLILLCRLY